MLKKRRRCGGFPDSVINKRKKWIWRRDIVTPRPVYREGRYICPRRKLQEDSRMMDRTRIQPLAVIIVILAVTVTISADDVKHKRVIVKVPKKINHVHHHHVKKVHVYKHKPKPIHSIHVVEEEEPIGKEWQNLFRAHHKHSKHSPHKGLLSDAWKYDIEEEDEELGFGDEGEEEEDEEEEFHKSESHNEPTVWKSQKKGERWNDYRGRSKKGRTTGRTSWKDDRPKRQHRNNAFYYSHEPYSRRPYSQKRPKKSSRTPKSRKSKKSKKPSRPIEKGYADYSEYNDEGHFNDSPLWPERKEHISWHLRENPWSQVPVVPQVTESPHFEIEDYGTEHKGEINLSKPEIQVVPAPQLGNQHVMQDPQVWTTQVMPEQMWTKQIVTQPPYLWTNEEFQEHNLWPKEAVHQTWSHNIVQEPKQVWQKPVSQEEDWKKPEIHEMENKKPFTQALKNKIVKKVTERPTTKKPIIREQKQVLNTIPVVKGQFHTEMNHSGTGYTSHVGHTADGEAASFQSVRFGDKIRNR